MFFKSFISILLIITFCTEHSLCSTVLCPDCPDKMDLVFLMDSSSSVMDESDTNWHYMLDFICGVVTRLNIGANNVRVGVMTFSDYSNIQIALNRYYMVDELVGEIRKIQHHGGNTNLGSALIGLRSVMFTSLHGARDDAVHMAILLTDGFATTVYQESVIQEADETKESGIVLMSVGIARRVHDNNLEKIASSPDYVIKVDNYTNLHQQVLPMVELIIAAEEQANDLLPSTTSTTKTSTMTSTTSTTTTTTTTTPIPTTTTSTTTKAPTTTTPTPTTTTTTSTTTSPTTTTTTPAPTTTTTSAWNEPVNNGNNNGAGSTNNGVGNTNKESDDIGGKNNPNTHVGTNNVVVINSGHNSTTIIIISLMGVLVAGIICCAVVIVLKKRKKSLSSSSTAAPESGSVAVGRPAVQPAVTWQAGTTAPTILVSPHSPGVIANTSARTSTSSNQSGEPYFVLDVAQAQKAQTVELSDNSRNEKLPPSYSAQ